MKFISDANLKTFVGESLGTGHDTFIALMIPLVCGRIETFCNRTFSKLTGGTPVAELPIVEYPQGGTTILSLKSFPVDSVTSIYEDEDRDFESDSLIDADDYYFDGKFIWRTDGGLWSDVVGAVKVTYKGGYTVTDGVLTGVPDDLKLAAYLQCTFLLKRRSTIGVQSITGGDGQMALLGPIELLPEVRRILKKYQRVI